MAAKIQRQKPDPFFNSDHHGNVIADAIHHALMPLDKIATDMESKWGCDRLPSLVSPETAALFGSAKAKLDAAIESNDPQEVARRAAVMIRGWDKMDIEAAERGSKALSPDIWSWASSEGFKVAITQSNAEAIKAIRTDKRLEGVAVYSLDEIGRILQAESHRLLDTAKKAFPEAVVSDVRPKQTKFDDEIPF